MGENKVINYGKLEKDRPLHRPQVHTRGFATCSR